jgi:diguanylate cyclase (GGDEF)-like protein
VDYFVPHYDFWRVATSVLIAGFASYVTLDLAKRVRADDHSLARIWWAAGSIAMGTGIWSMHFVGMRAYRLPIALGYTRGLTFLSWAAAVAVSGIALYVASRGKLTTKRLAIGSTAMGAGICAMHYIGMAALDLAPGIVWNWALVAVSAAIAVVASAAALLIFFWLRRLPDGRDLRYQAAAALVMGLAISGMHYTAMAAANVPTGSICLSAADLGGEGLASLVGLASGTLLAMTLFTSILDGRMQGKTSQLASSLKAANIQLRTVNEELRRQAVLDPLTQLANRLLFEDRLSHALARCQRPESSQRAANGERNAGSLAVLFVDLDGFKAVNDSFGHAAGDAVLQETARRLLGTARASDTVARVGGDEFLVLIEDVDSVPDCTALAQRQVDALALPFDVLNRTIEISASVGIAVFPEHGSGEKLVARADAAMYAAKKNGGNSFALFESRMDGGPLEALSLQNDLRHAVDRGELRLLYQPKIDGRAGCLSGVEALLRWNHPTLGTISPAVFIPIAERFGIIHRIGSWVIEEACRQARAWEDDGLRTRIAVNVSAHQLRQPDLVERVDDALRRYRVHPARLLLEITESVAMGDIKATQRGFESLSRIGVFLSIDDFGTGYSSLSYLRQLPAKELKIDRSFIKDLKSSGDARAVVDAVVRLAHALGLQVVAEGVETEAQRDILLALGCDELQGYLFARPMSAPQLANWARRFAQTAESETALQA